MARIASSIEPANNQDEYESEQSMNSQLLFRILVHFTVAVTGQVFAGREMDMALINGKE